MIALFKTLDGVAELLSADAADDAPVIMRPMRPHPTICGKPPMQAEFMECRRYERVYKTYQGYPVYEEQHAKHGSLAGGGE